MSDELSPNTKPTPQSSPQLPFVGGLPEHIRPSTKFNSRSKTLKTRDLSGIASDPTGQQHRSVGQSVSISRMLWAFHCNVALEIWAEMRKHLITTIALTSLALAGSAALWLLPDGHTGTKDKIQEMPAQMKSTPASNTGVSELERWMKGTTTTSTNKGRK